MNGDSKSTNERGPTLVGLLGLSCRYKRFLPCLGCSGQPNTKYVFFTVHFLNFWCPHRPTCLADSRAWSPVSYYVSLVATVGFLIQQSASSTLRNCDTKLMLNYCKQGSFLLITKFKGGVFMVFLPTVFTTASSAETLKFHCIGRMLGLNPGMLRLWH